MGTCGSLAEGSIGGTLSDSRPGTAVTQLTFLTGRWIVVVVLIFVDAARIFRPSVVSGSGKKRELYVFKKWSVTVSIE